MPLVCTRAVLGAALVVLGCGPATKAPPLQVLSWTGGNGSEVALDAQLTVEFSQPLLEPIRRSSVQLLDEAGGVVDFEGMTVAGRWLTLEPRLPRSPQLEDGSLQPDRSYRIQLLGLPSLAAVASSEGGMVEQTVWLEFRTVAARNPDAFVGLGAEFTTLRLAPRGTTDALAFHPGAPLVLEFEGGLDPRTLTGVATLTRMSDGQERACRMRLIENRRSFSRLEVLAEDWRGWWVLTLPGEIEGLGGWPLAERSRVRRVYRGEAGPH